jgi:hypothetical protein
MPLRTCCTMLTLLHTKYAFRSYSLQSQLAQGVPTQVVAWLLEPSSKPLAHDKVSLQPSSQQLSQSMLPAAKTQQPLVRCMMHEA